MIASGIVINTGPYIKKIPDEVIQFGNEFGFPIFTMPWEVHVVDVTRDFFAARLSRWISVKITSVTFCKM